ncbi:MAG: protein translocase subunit SecD [Patescibacteria group bacterium]
MKQNRWFFILILFLTAISLLINFSQPYQIKAFGTTISIPGLAPSTYLGFLSLKPDFSLHEGLDLAGGTSVTLRAEMDDIPDARKQAALDSAKEVIERRINFFGVSEPVVQTAKVNDDYRIIVEIPGVTDVNQAVALVGKTAKLTFWQEGEGTFEASEAAQIASTSGVPIGIAQFMGPTAKKTDLTGADLKEATVTFDPSTGKPQVGLNFTSAGAKKFGQITKDNVGKILAIALDDQIIEAPRVNEAIYGGQAVISGEFTTDQAKTVQIQLNAGALPISLTVLEQHAIGASLGNDSIQKSLIAGSLGFVVIVVFMIGLYGRLGVIASMALIVYTLLMLALFRLIPVTLTLAGIAGFILSIGIAVDANILIFERVKEELRRGRSREAAIRLGFSRAWLSIRDSNVASLLISAILFYFGTGVIKGFAVTLALGVFVSLFSAIVVTRTFLRTFYKE